MEERTIQDYCRVIDKLDKGDGVRSVEIVASLKLSKNTVAFTLQKLSKLEFITMKRYGKVKLNSKGLNVAKKMNFKHRVIESFLFSKLKIAKNKIHSEACALEHWFSDETIKKLYIFIGSPKTDPHGRSII